MALSSKVESLVRMIDAFKTARYDQNAGHDARYPWKDDHISWLHNVYDLVTSAAVKSQKRYTKILMDTLSMLFGICGIEEQSLRLAASETLNKIVKATYLTHITRIQMTAFNEMKKNGNVRSLKVALTLFSAICPHLQPLRCKPTIHSLAAVLVNIMKRNEESINECLRDFLVDIFRVFACHLVDRDVQLLFEAFLSLLPSTSATTRRMTSTGIAALVEFGRRPLVYGKWVLIRMMNLLAIEEIQNGTSCLLGVLQAIRNLIPVLFALGEEVETALPHTLYAFLITCVVYEGDHNVVTSTLEVFQVILQYVPQLPQFSQWLVRPSSDTFLIEPFVRGSRLLVSPSSDSDRLRGRSSPLQKGGDSSCEMTSLHDDYFSSSRESLEVLEPDDDGTEDLEDSTFTPNAGMEEEDAVIIDVVGEEPTAFSKPLSPSMLPVSSPMPSSSPLPRSPNSSFSVVSGAVISTEVVKGSAHKVSWNEDLNLYVNLSACFVVASGNKAQSESINDSLSVPIVHLTQLLGYCFLDSKDQSPVRVSVRSLALSCLMHSVSLYPGALLCVGLPVGGGGRCYGRLPEGSSMFGGRLLDVVKTYSDNSDPKLRGHVATVIGAYLRSSLHLSLGRYTHFASKWTRDDLKAEDLIEHLVKLSTDESHLVLRSLCTAAIDCLPLLFQSGFAKSALRLFTALLQLKKSTYWLVKVALVQLLSSVNYAHVCAAEYIVHSRGGDRQEEALETVFELLGSDDQRVRDIAAEGLAKLVPNLCFGESEAAVLNQVAQVEATSQFPRTVGSNSQLPGSGGGGQPKHTQAQISIVLDRIVNVILATSNQHQMLGCVGGLNHLARLYPPLLNQDAWKCGSKLSHGWLTLLIPTITSSWLTHNLQGHAELMDFVSHLLSGVALKDVREKPSEGRDFTALKTDRLAKMMNELFVHLMKVLNVFAHVIESKEADQKLPKPYWELSKSTASSPAKSSPSSKEKPSDKSRKFGIVIRTDTLSKEVGHYRSQLHYIKLLEGIRSAYSNYQLNLDFEGSDKFSFLLSSVLNCLSAILEVSTFQDIAKHTEEIMGYIHITVQVDPRGSLLCTQQLLNALFGLNAAVHRMNIVSSTLYSPVEPFLFLSRTHTLQSVLDVSRHSSNSLYGLCITDPFERMSSIIATAMPPGAAEDTKRRSKAKGSREETDGLLSKTKEPTPKIVLHQRSPFKPANPVGQIQDYIKYFNQVIVLAMKEFPLTSSVLFQERVLFMLHQLLLLKVRYEPLDPNNNFLNAVLKHIDVLERGRAKDGEKLVPYIFQFLVLLSQDQTCKEISLPKVIQLCDTVMASGHSAMLFVLPALKPLVINLFVHTPLSLLGDPKLLSALREMVVEKMLRLIVHHGTWDLFSVIFERQGTADLKPVLARQVLAALLPPLAKLQLKLDSIEAISTLQRLLMLVGTETPEIQPLFAALNSATSLHSLRDLWRWAGGLLAILRLVVVVANDDCLQLHLKDTKWTPPILQLKEITPSTGIKQREQHEDSSMAFVRYLFTSLQLLSSSLVGVLTTPAQSSDALSLLAHVTGDLLLALQYLLHEGFYPKVYFCACSSVTELEELVPTFQCLSGKWPLLSLHFYQLLSLLKSECVPHTTMMSDDAACTTANLALVARVTNLIQLNHMLSEPTLMHNYLSVNTLLESSDEEPVVRLVKKLKKDSSLSELLLKKLTQLNWPSLTNTMKLQILQFLREFLHRRETSPAVGMLLLDHFIIKGVPRALVVQAVRYLTKLVKGGLQLREETKSKIASTLEDLLLTDTELHSLVTVKSANLQLDSTNIPAYYELVTLDWLISSAQKLCSIVQANAPDLTRLLLIMDGESVMSLFTSPQFNEVILEQCIRFVVEMARVQSPERVGQFYWIPSTPPSSSPFNRIQILANVMKVSYFDRVVKWCHGNHTSSLNVLVGVAMWLFSAPPSFPALSTEEKRTAMTFGLKLLEDISGSPDPSKNPDLDQVLKYMGKILEDSTVTSILSEKELSQWTINVSHTLYGIVHTSLKPGVQLPEVIPVVNDGSRVSENTDEFKSDCQRTISQVTSLLEALLTGLLSSSQNSFSMPKIPKTSFPSSALVQLKGVILGLARLPLIHPYCVAPPNAYKMGWDGPDEGFIPDDILVERDVLTQLNRQIGSIGWLKRQQFEEFWMLYLTVLNQMTSPDATDTPEALEVAQIMCCCIQGMTNLIAMSKLTPFSGNPLSSHQLHTHRHKDITFMGSRLGRKLSYLLGILDDSRKSTSSFVQSQFPPPCVLYSQNLEKLYPSSEPARGQLSLASLWPIMLVETVSPATDRGGDRSDVDPRSSVMFLLEQFTTWLTNSEKLSSIVKAEIIKSVVIISDVFSTSGQFDWMLVTFLEQLNVCSQDDVITYAALVYGLLKSSAVCRIPAAVAETVAKLAEESLSSENTQIQISCLSGLLFALEDSSSSLVPLVAPLLCSYLLKNLTLDSIYTCSQYHVIVMWSVAMALVESHFWHVKEVNEFATKLLVVAYSCLSQHSTKLSDPVLQAFGEGMERLALKGLLGKEEKRKLCTVASKKLQEVPVNQMLCYIRLLLVCMYSGEAGESISGNNTENEDTANLVIRECITAVLERFRRSHKSQTDLIVQVLPTVLVDFLTPADAISAVIHEILSPQQVHFTQCAELMSKVFELLIAIDQLPLITEWTLLSLNSFTQRTPVSLAIWSILCLLLASCASKELRAFLPAVASQNYKGIELRGEFMDILYKCSCYYYKHQCSSDEDKTRFILGLEGLTNHPVHTTLLKLVNT